MGDDAEKNLMKLYRARKNDVRQSKTKRRRAVENRPDQIKDLLGAYFQKDQQAMRRIEETRAVMAWEKYVGPAAARFSQALKMRGHQLIVRVRDPLWMQQLSLLKNEILKKYAKDFPRLSIRDLYFTTRTQ